MALVNNIGIGKDFYYNPFKIQITDTREWYDEVMRRELLPKQMFGIGCEYEFQEFSTPEIIILRAYWNNKSTSIYAFRNKGRLEITNKNIGIHISNYIHKYSPKAKEIQSFSSLYIDYELN